MNKSSKQMENQRRNRAVTGARLRASIKSPAKRVTVLVIMILGCAAGRIKIPFPGDNRFPELVTLWGYATILLCLAVSALLALTILTLPPLNAKSIQAGLESIGLVDRYGYTPVLLFDQRMKNTRNRTLTFYSRGIAKETWEKRQQAIEDVLNVHSIRPIEYGGKRKNNRNYIVLAVAPGAESRREEPLYDDEL